MQLNNMAQINEEDGEQIQGPNLSHIQLSEERKKQVSELVDAHWSTLVEEGHIQMTRE